MVKKASPACCPSVTQMDTVPNILSSLEEGSVHQQIGRAGVPGRGSRERKRGDVKGLVCEGMGSYWV